MNILSVTDAKVYFDGLKAVDGVSLEVAPGRVVGLIGPNGAGKTTLFNAISGHVPITGGTVELMGTDVTTRGPHHRARLGLARTFQLGGLIDELTALENVVLGLDQQGRIGDSHVPRNRLRSVALTMLDELGLSDVGDELVEALPMGIRRQVEVIRAVAAQPHLVLLDEPGAGLTETERAHLSTMVRGLASDRLSFVITDHSTDLVFSVSDEVLAMNFGREVAHGEPDVIRRDRQVMEAYLGTATS